jgi:hypothetical protein
LPQSSSRAYRTVKWLKRTAESPPARAPRAAINSTPAAAAARSQAVQVRGAPGAIVHLPPSL